MSTIAYWLRHGFYKDTTKLVDDARLTLADVEFDTIVCTGLSGVLIAPILWRALDVPCLAVVRKPGESTHSDNIIEGEIGYRWLFVDDFKCTGATFQRVRNAVAGYMVHGPTRNVGAYYYDGARYVAP